ncbi:MAG: hypothetical protein IJM51_06320 [Clostridia bacterium]|nr:hypothetical protein [Clostridia bacterium]
MRKSNAEIQTTKARHVAVFRLLAVMLMAVMLSSHVISGVFANYATAGAGRGGAKVAVFSVDANGNTTEGLRQSIKSVTAGDVTTYQIVITNTSEVKVSYTVEISFKNNMGQYFTARLNAGIFTDTMKWENAGQLAPGGTESCTLEIKVKDAPAFAQAQMAALTEGEYSDNFGFETYVTFTQID